MGRARLAKAVCWWLAATVVMSAPSPARVQIVLQLTDLAKTETSLAAVDDSGSVAFAISSADPYGTNAAHLYQIFRWDPATGAGEQVTSFPAGVVPYLAGPSVSDDGQRLVFLSRGDLNGENPDHSAELFVMQANGGGLVQLTDTSGPDSVRFGHYALSGGGARVVFDSDADYEGANPARVDQVWVVEVDGTGLRQVTNLAEPWFSLRPTISDDGQRIAFVTGEDAAGTGNVEGTQVFGVLSDGTGLHQITFTESGISDFPQISGDGSTIAFRTSAPLDPPTGGCPGGEQVAVVSWDGTGLRNVSGACLGDVAPGSTTLPDVTDDGQVVFYAARDLAAVDTNPNWEVFRVNRDATGKTALTDTDDGPGPVAQCRFARVAGGGGRVAFLCEDGEPYGGPNPDLGRELYAMTGSGTQHRQLSEGVEGDSTHTDLTSDGAWVVFASDANPLDEPGYWRTQLYRMAPGGSDLARITDFAGGTPKQPSITDDGSLIAFAHDGDPLGSNGYGAYQILVVNADGGGLRQLTPGRPGQEPSDAPDISGDGSVIVFQSRADPLGEGLPGGWSRVYKVAPDGTGLARLSPAQQDSVHPRVDATGTWVVYVHEGQVHRQRTDGTGDLTITTDGQADWPDVTMGGGQVVYAAAADPLGSNPEANLELFLWEAAGGTTRQLTSTGSGSSVSPTFSRDGARVYFLSDAPHVGEEQEGFLAHFRVETATGRVERVGGLAPCGDPFDATWHPMPRPVAVGEAGRLAALGTFGDCTGRNADGSGEIVVIDRTTAARIRVSPGSAPTVVDWDVESGPVRYDVIRGDVASLGFAGPQVVDLGPVVCVEDDSFDANTVNSEDGETPWPGQAFFYLYRGSQGPAAGPGSYGQASGGRERLAGPGDCPGG